LNAPYAFNVQERAVTLADYARSPSAIRTASRGRLFRVTRVGDGVHHVELTGGMNLQKPRQTAATRSTTSAEFARPVSHGRQRRRVQNVKLVPIDMVMHVSSTRTTADEVQQALLHALQRQHLPTEPKGYSIRPVPEMGAPY